MRLLLLLICVLSSSARADLDSSQKEGLKKTQDLLTNSKERDKALANDPKAKDIDAKAGALAGSSANKEEMYSISSELIEKIVKQTDGDPAKMQQLLNEAQKDPKAFYEKYFDDGQKSRVRNLATKIEGNKVGVPAK